MTKDDIIRAAKECKRLFSERTGAEPAEMEDKSAKFTISKEAIFDDHVLWACDQIVDLASQGTEKSLEKANRWLGWVQGFMIRDGCCSINEQRDLNRSVPNREDSTI
jgi:hypothetical protein